MIGFLFAAFGVLFGFGTIQVRQFEHAAAVDIRSQLRGNAVVAVQTKMSGLLGAPLGEIKEATIRAEDFQTDGLPLFVEPWRSKRGKVERLNIDLSNFDLGKLHVASLVASIPDCRFDLGLASRHRKIRLSQSGVGLGSVTIMDRDLEHFILNKFHEIKKVTVRTEKGKVFIEGDGEFVIVKTHFNVIATLVSPDGHTLELANTRIFFDDKPADELARKALLQTLNPVVDLQKDLKLYDAITVKGIELENGRVRAWGDTKIPLSPNPPPGPGH